jgi:hypothetical protein
VLTSDGEGTVIETKPLAAQVRVKLSDNEKDAPKLYAVKDVKILRVPKRSKQKKNDDDELLDIVED